MAGLVQLSSECSSLLLVLLPQLPQLLVQQHRLSVSQQHTATTNNSMNVSLVTSSIEKRYSRLPDNLQSELWRQTTWQSPWSAAATR